MLTVYLVEYVTNLFLSKPLCIKDSGEPIAFLFLVAEYGEYLRMEVAVAVSRDTELKFSPSISGAGTIAITFISRIISQKLAALRDHHTLDHDLHQVVKTISFRCVLAHQLGKL